MAVKIAVKKISNQTSFSGLGGLGDTRAPCGVQGSRSTTPGPSNIHTNALEFSTPEPALVTKVSLLLLVVSPTLVY
jgi:hypothetical protein